MTQRTLLLVTLRVIRSPSYTRLIVRHVDSYYDRAIDSIIDERRILIHTTVSSSSFHRGSNAARAWSHQGGSDLLINDPANQINNSTSVDRVCYRVVARRPSPLSFSGVAFSSAPL